MKSIGLVLVVLGVLALVYGGVSYDRQRTVLDVGPFKATATEQKNIPLSPTVGGIVLLGGVILLVAWKSAAARDWAAPGALTNFAIRWSSRRGSGKA